MFLLKILWSFLNLGKCLHNKLRKVFATLVVTFLLKVELKQMILRLRFRFRVFCFSLWNFISAFWYLPFFYWYVLDDLRGWLENMLTYNKGSLGFLYGRYVSIVRLKLTSKMSTILSFVLISISTTTSLKIFITFFLIWSIFCVLTLRNNIKPNNVC